jgi:hypothetical protein
MIFCSDFHFHRLIVETRVINCAEIVIRLVRPTRSFTI